MNTYISLYFNVIYAFVFDCFRVLVYGVFHFGNSHSLNDRSRAKCLQSPFLILRFFFVRLILSMSGGRNAVKCKANTKYGHLSSKGAAGYFLPSVRLNPIGWPTLRACGTLTDSAAIA